MKLLWFNVTVLTIVLLVLLISEYWKLAHYEFFRCNSIQISKHYMRVEYTYDELSYYAELPRDFLVKAKNIRDYGLYYDAYGMPQLMRLRKNTSVQSVTFLVTVILMVASYTDLFTLYGLQIMSMSLFIADTFLDARKDCVRNLTFISEDDSSLHSQIFQMLFYADIFKRPLFFVMHAFAIISLIGGVVLLYYNPNVNYEFYKVCSELPYTLYPVPIKNLVLMVTDGLDNVTQPVLMSMIVYLYNLMLMVYIKRLFPWDMVWYNKYKSSYLTLTVNDDYVKD